MSRTHLVVVNDGHNLESAMEYACETFPEDAITAIYVDTASTDVEPIHLDEAGGSLDDWLRAHRAEADRAFEDARAAADDHGVDLATVVAFGGFPDAIRQYCANNPVDTVVVGCRDRDAFSSYIVGDDVTRIANTAPVPVIVV
jgi:nucleotide-binding universal stress UspA family protein